jgi:hypothetical protein
LVLAETIGVRNWRKGMGAAGVAGKIAEGVHAPKAAQTAAARLLY